MGIDQPLRLAQQNPGERAVKPETLDRGAQVKAAPRLALHELLAGLPADETALAEVGFAVNDARYDGPECLAPPAAAQDALF